MPACDGYSHEGIARVRRRAREQRVRLAAREQRGQLFQQAQQLYDLHLRQGMLQQFFEIFDLLLLPPRARRTRSHARRETRMRHRRTRMPRGPHAGVLALPCAHSMCVQYVAYRHDTPHGMRARGAYETSVFEHYGATSTTDVT